MIATETDTDRFFAEFLAAVRLELAENANTLSANRVAINRAFWSALNSTAGEFVDQDAYGIDYNPLYAVCPWFERALTRAQRDLLISFPNPSYEKIAIRLDPSQARELLEEAPEQGQLVGLARAFIANLTPPE